MDPNQQSPPPAYGSSAPYPPQQPGYPPQQQGYPPQQPGYPPQQPTPQQPTQANREDIYRTIVQKYEISQDFARRMQMLQGFKTVFIFDDSGSMKAPLEDSPLNQAGSMLRASRWDELKYFAEISIEIASVFDSNGCDVHFLNKGPFNKIMHASQLEQQFREGPGGYTPLANAFNAVLSQNRDEIREKKLLVIVVTDGQPTDTVGNVDIKGFKNVLQSRSPMDRIFCTIVACTDDDSCIDYLDKWDRQIPNLDVCDDYRTERQQIRKVQGSQHTFSYGDYVVKSLIGAIDPELDQADEKKSKKDCIIS